MHLEPVPMALVLAVMRKRGGVRRVDRGRGMSSRVGPRLIERRRHGLGRWFRGRDEGLIGAFHCLAIAGVSRDHAVVVGRGGLQDGTDACQVEADRPISEASRDAAL